MFTKTTLLDRIRTWVLKRKEFCILDLLDDEENKTIAEEVTDVQVYISWLAGWLRLYVHARRMCSGL
jgi:hypothetical protein